MPDPSPPKRTTYRHGDLHHALIAAGTELARVGGPDAVVLREATRRVGVAPNAAYRHFADRQALLDAVCSAAQSLLAVAIENELATVPTTGEAAETLGRNWVSCDLDQENGKAGFYVRTSAFRFPNARLEDAFAAEPEGKYKSEAKDAPGVEP